MSWKIAEAKQQLSKVVQLAQTEPQTLQRRDEAVAVIVSAEEYRRFEGWKERSEGSLADAFARVRAVAVDEGWELSVAPRTNRAAALPPRRTMKKAR